VARERKPSGNSAASIRHWGSGKVSSFQIKFGSMTPVQASFGHAWALNTKAVRTFGAENASDGEAAAGVIRIGMGKS